MGLTAASRPQSHVTKMIITNLVLIKYISTKRCLIKLKVSGGSYFIVFHALGLFKHLWPTVCVYACMCAFVYYLFSYCMSKFKVKRINWNHLFWSPFTFVLFVESLESRESNIRRSSKLFNANLCWLNNQLQ